MTTKILLAPVGAGKTESVLNQLIHSLDQKPLGRVWALLATRRQTDAFRQRLAEWESGRDVFFNVEFFDFYRLYQRLIDMAGNPQRPLSDAARLQLLRTLMVRIQPELDVFGPIAQTPGFIRIVADFIAEMKQNRIYPEAYVETALTLKDRDLAKIYHGYQAYLKEFRLVDSEGEGWLAVEALADNRTLAGNLALLLVDGFDQFTPVQADLLTQLAERADEALITLTTVPGREETVGRRFQHALDQLRSRFLRTVPIIDTLSGEAGGDRHPDLLHIIDKVFLPELAPQKSSNGVAFIEAPDPAAEVAAVLRKVKRLLLDHNDVAPDDILIALRDWERYRTHFAILKQKYQLPLALHYGDPLAENPAIIAFLRLLQLHDNDFRRRDLLDVLRSPYFRLDAGLDADLLERISRRYMVTGGRDQWLQACQQAHRSTIDTEEEETLEALLDEEAAGALADLLAGFFDAVTPPEEAPLPEYVAWVEDLIGLDDQAESEESQPPPPPQTLSLQMVDCLRDPAAPDTIIARDLAAMRAFKQALAGMLAAQELVGSFEYDHVPVLDWATYSADLLATTGSAAINAQPSRFGQVLVTTATNARGLPHKHVFILGLSEGLFPMQTPEDPLHLDSERRALQAAGIPLQTHLERRADDGLFYELVCLPRESVTFSRPTLQEGKPWIESPLWRAVTALFADADALIAQDRVGVGEVVAVADAAARDEAVIAAAASLNQPVDDVPENTWPVIGWLNADEPDYWQGVHTGRQMEAGRMSNAPFDQYSGKLADDRLITQVARKLDQRRVWSASQFNDYGMCGFRFYAKRLLKLEALKDPEEGMDAAQRGTLNHAILERSYRKLQEARASIEPDNLEELLAVVREEAEAVFAEAPRDLGFRESALWEQDKAIILRKLEKLVELDFTESPIAKAFGSALRTPYLLEAPFGFGGNVNVSVDLGEEVGPVRLLGYIDRIDQQGQSAIVIDYKSGSTRIPVKELEEGRNFQMMVYLLAADAILAANDDADGPTQVSGGLFWHLSNRQTSGAIHMDENGQVSIEQAKGHLARHIARGREGDFAVYPTKPDQGRCVRYCDFHQLCRVSVTNRYKA